MDPLGIAYTAGQVSLYQIVFVNVIDLGIEEIRGNKLINPRLWR